MLVLFLSASVILNIVLIYVVVKSWKRLLFIGDNIDDLSYSVSSFREHLTKVYELEMFYGDETLQNLLNHSAELEKYLFDLEASFSAGELSDDGREESETEEEEIQEKT